MQHTIKVEHVAPLHFGLKSAGIGLLLSMVFLTSCDFNGEKVPRYNTVQGQKRLPLHNQEFAQPISSAQPQPSVGGDQHYIHVEPQAFDALQSTVPEVAAEPIDPRPVGYREDAAAAPAPYDSYAHQPGVLASLAEGVGLGADVPAPPAAMRAVPARQPLAAQANVQQDPFAGLPQLPTPNGDYPHLREVPDVPQKVQNFASAEHNEIFAELEQARHSSMQAKDMFAGETAIPAHYFQQQPMPAAVAEPLAKRVPQDNYPKLGDVPQLPTAAPSSARYAPKDEIVFEAPAMAAPSSDLPPLPAPPAPEYMRSAGYAAPAQAAPAVVQAPAPVEYSYTAPAPAAAAPTYAAPQPAPLAPIQLRAPQAVAAGQAPIQLRAPSAPYGQAETLRSSRYVSRYATRRLRSSGGVY